MVLSTTRSRPVAYPAPRDSWYPTWFLIRVLLLVVWAGAGVWAVNPFAESDVVPGLLMAVLVLVVAVADFGVRWSWRRGGQHPRSQPIPRPYSDSTTVTVAALLSQLGVGLHAAVVFHAVVAGMGVASVFVNVLGRVLFVRGRR